MSGGVLVVSMMEVLVFGCCILLFMLVDYFYMGLYVYLVLVCYLLEWYDFMVWWWMWEGFDWCLEGLLICKGLNKNDLEELMLIVWWFGFWEDMCLEGKMRYVVIVLLKVIVKVCGMCSFCVWVMLVRGLWFGLIWKVLFGIMV